MTLPAGEVHVWKASLDDCSPSQYGRFQAVLDEQEQARVGRFYFERDRRRFTAARAWLRILLGTYLGSEPGTLVFGYTERGKPFLTTPSATVLRFNLSHSGGHALLALTQRRELGVDLEAGARLGDDWPAIARRYFSAREQAELATVATNERRAAFLHGWARKEAYLKATGLGISDGLQKIEVSLAPGQPPSFLSPSLAEGWTFVPLEGCPSPAALVVQKHHPDEAPPNLQISDCAALPLF